MATKNPLMGRVLDIAHADSLALNILGPRSFTAEELLLLTGDVATLEGFLMVLSAKMLSTRSHQTYSGGGSTVNTKMTYHLATYTSGDDFTCGDLAIPGFSVQQKVTDAVPTVDGTQDAQSIGINYAGELLTNVNLSAAQLHAMLKYLPSEIYHAIGSLFEEIAAAFYKGVGDISLISQYRQQAIIRLQDKITKTRIDQAKDIAIYTTEGVVTGEDDYLGYVQARDTSHVFLQALAPNIYNWVFDQVPLGIRAYTIDE